MRDATLRGYSRHSIKDQVFPAIIPSEAESVVHGKKCMFETAKQLCRLVSPGPHNPMARSSSPPGPEPP
eukprot:gene21743-28766_t